MCLSVLLALWKIRETWGVVGSETKILEIQRREKAEDRPSFCLTEQERQTVYKVE